MASNYTFTMITYFGDEGISHWGWEITTRAAVITNRSPIKQSKNTCYNSLLWHAKNFLGVKVQRPQVKHRNEGSAGYETASAN